MNARSLPLILCGLLAAGCGASRSSSSSATSAASTSSSSTTSTTTSSTTTPPPPPPPANFQPVAFETVDQGSMSQRQAAGEVQIASDADWGAFWPTHSQAALPTVDFQREAVVGTFLGFQPSGGYGTQVVNVFRDANSDDLQLVVRSSAPGSWRITPSVITTPYHIVRCATAVSGQGALGVVRQELLDFETLAAGANSALGAGDPTYTGGLRVLRDAAAFSAFYAQIQPGAVPPVVDFQRDMVVAVLGPYVASFGNTVETRRIVHDGATDELRVISRVNPYRGGAAPPPATETPFQLLRVTRATGTIRAERTTAVTTTRLATGFSGVWQGAAETLLIRDAATLAQVWRTHVGAAPPVVDFTQDQVVFAIEPAGSARTLGIARCVLLEDDELSVTVHAATGIVGPMGSSYAAVTMPRSFGPAMFETIDITPHP